MWRSQCPLASGGAPSKKASGSLPPAAAQTSACQPPPGQGFEGLTQRISDYQAEKAARAAAVKAEEEEARLRECSFAPDINRRRVEAKVDRAEWV